MSDTQTKVLTNAVLSPILSNAMVSRGTTADVDTAMQTGIYYLGDSTQNVPPGISPVGSVLEVLAWDSNRVYQRITSIEGIIWRVRAFAWRAWQKVTLTPLAT